MDVDTAFLNGELKETIYMEVTEGINKGQTNQVCKLNKAIYGLKQSARCWFECFDNVIRSYGFKNSLVDCCIYFRKENNQENHIYLVLYVDDLVIATGNTLEMNKLKKLIMENS